mmetsp:Transcript_47127/g.75704  ORF Transcript_47127/g.75704 Transcript_47127/m.75704 type:complete len:91 (+) Transcript_47127:1643-1915(+)
MRGRIRFPTLGRPKTAGDTSPPPQPIVSPDIGEGFIKAEMRTCVSFPRKTQEDSPSSGGAQDLALEQHTFLQITSASKTLNHYSPVKLVL